MDRADGWARLSGLLGDDDAVVEAVRAALTESGDPWEALLDGLDDAGALAYLQSDDTGMELTDALAQLPRVFASGVDLNEATDTDDLGDATRVADAALAAAGLRVVRLVEDDESWPLVVVPDERVDEVVALAAALDAEIVTP